MFWKRAKPFSLVSKLVTCYCASLFLILAFVTLTIYPSLKVLLKHAEITQQIMTLFLTKLCLRNLFIGIWVAALGSVFASYLIAKYSLKSLSAFSTDMSEMKIDPIDLTLAKDKYPKELDELAEICNEMFVKINSKFKSIKRFSTLLAHELKNPLHCLQNATEVNLSKPLSVDEYQTLLEENLEEYKNISMLIDDLLFIARNEEGLISLNIENIAAAELISPIVDYYQYLADEKNISIQLEGDLPLRVDITLFKRVMANLLDNAVKFSFPSSMIYIKSREENSKAVITIENQGPSIKQALLPYLFKEFYLSNELNRHEEQRGLGVGLKIVGSIVKAHEGEVFLKCSNNKKTVVTLVLPS